MRMAAGVEGAAAVTAAAEAVAAARAAAAEAAAAEGATIAAVATTVVAAGRTSGSSNGSSSGRRTARLRGRRAGHLRGRRAGHLFGVVERVIFGVVERLVIGVVERLVFGEQQRGSSSGGTDCGSGTSGSTACSAQAVTCSPAYVPPKISPSACTANDVTTFYDDCLNPLPLFGADRRRQRGRRDVLRLPRQVQPADPTWGPLVQYAGIWELNVGGCFGVEGASAACATATRGANRVRERIVRRELLEHDVADEVRQLHHVRGYQVLQ